MGKSKKVRNIKVLDPDKPNKTVPLAEQYLEDTSVRAPGRTKTRKRQEDEEFVDDKLSRRILEQARQQQEELQDEHGVGSGKADGGRRAVSQIHLGTAASADAASDSEEDASDQDEVYEEVQVDADDEKALQRFMSANPPARRTLADIIMEKITEKQTEIHTQMSDNASVQFEQMDERVVNMYKEVKAILCKYRSGKLPKAFKIIPALANWEQILYLTDPESWSAAAVYQATRIFASNLNSKMAQRFFNLVLLPRIRDDISEYKRLNYHLYMALRKALFKPAAFFKGVLLPLCESGTCTLREATIVGSVLAKNSIPMLHSAAAMLKIAEMDYNGANSIFLRTLLDKKYALPFRVTDAVVFHFLKFQHDKRELPVLWHQCFLTFVQRYKEDISSEQKEVLMDILRVHVHESMTPEIRRELVSSKCRDTQAVEPGGPASMQT